MMVHKPSISPSTPPCPCRKGRQLVQWFAAKGDKAAHTKPSLFSAQETFLRQVTPAHTAWKGR